MPNSETSFPWKLGDYREIVHTFREEELSAFASLTGDRNPLHMDEYYARRTATGGRVVHGMLAASFVSTLIGEQIPGPGALWQSFQVNWRRMIRIGDTLRLQARVVAIQAATRTLDLEILGAHMGTGETYLDGTARVMIMAETKNSEHSTTGKRVLVTGASGEVGRAVCRRLGAEGHHLVLLGRDAERLKAIARELGSSADSWLSVDLLDERAVERALDQVVAGPPVEIYIHAASAPLGYREIGSDGYQAELHAQWTVSASSFSRIAQRLLPVMPGGSAIVAVLTQYILDAPPVKLSSYVSGKMAAWSLVKSIASEFGPKGIRCNAVSPGVINTPFSRDMPVRAKQVEAATNPMRRICTVEDVADAVAYLCSPQSAYVNGVNLPVTGGSRMP